MLSWRIYVGSNNCMYIPRFSRKAPDIFPRLLPNLVSKQIALDVPNIKFHGNPYDKGRADTAGGRTDLTTLIGAFATMRKR